MKVIAAASAVAFGLAACVSGIPPTGGPTEATFPSPSRNVVLASVSPRASQPTLTGTLPRPGETVPAGQPVIEALALEDLATIWSSLGLTCRSHTSGGPESPAAYNVHCERSDVRDNVDVVAEADLWTLDGVADVHVSVTPIEGSVDAAATARRWLTPFAELAGDDAAEWLEGHVNDAACRRGCTKGGERDQVSYYSAVHGAQEFFLVAIK